MRCLRILSCVALLSACGGSGRSVPPALSDTAVTTAEDTPASFAVPLTASDVQAVTLTVSTAPAHGTVTGSGPTWTYTPVANYNGPDSLVVKAQDSHGSATAIVTVTVTAVNDAPVANSDSFATAFETPLTIAPAMLVANDTDVDSATLMVTGVTAASDGHGTANMTGDSVTFTPESGYQGTAKFVYTVSDGTASAQGMVTVSIGAAIGPIAVDDTAMTDEDTTAVIDDATLLANDSDPEHHTLMVSAVSNARHGSVSRSGTQTSFVPDANFNGSASFDYTITDGLGTATATVTLMVNPIDDPPVAVNDSFVVTEDSTGNALDVLANDTDVDGGPRTVASITQSAHGSIAIASGGASVTYAPATGYCNEVPNTGIDTFTYTVMPGGTTATVSVAVNCTCGLKQTTDFIVGSN